MKSKFGIIILLPLILLLLGCKADKTTEKKPLFMKLSSQETGIDFYNFIKEDYYHNIFNFDYMYNGAGISIGDINNDGLSDIYFTGNVANNKLFPQ